MSKIFGLGFATLGCLWLGAALGLWDFSQFNEYGVASLYFGLSSAFLMLGSRP